MTIKLPKGMQEVENCDICHKPMTISGHFMRDNKEVIVKHVCTCGYSMGYVYFDKWVTTYKNALAESKKDEAATPS